jgi:hypothetical protein
MDAREPHAYKAARPLDSREERERAKTRALPAELPPQISERMRPSRFHVLQNFTPLRALTRNITHSSHRVLDSQASLAHGEHQRVCATPGESPGNHRVVKQRPGRARGTGVHARERTNPVEGFTSRTEHCWVVLGADAERDLRWLRLSNHLGVPRPACAFGAESPKGGYRSSSVPKWR